MTVGVPAHWLPAPALLEELDTAALAVDASGEVRRSNGAADRAYAGPDGVLPGRRLASIFAEGDRDALAGVIRQVLDGDRWQGRVELLRADGTRHDADVSCTPLREGGRVPGLLCMIVDSSPEGRRMRDARLLSERLTRIARVTGELGRAQDVEDVTQIVTTHSADAVGATIAGLLVRESEESFRLIGLRGGRKGDREHYAHVSVDDGTVVRDVVRTGRRVLVRTPEIAERYPDMLDRGDRTVLALPLTMGSRTIGVISLSFPGARVLDAAELEFLEILADGCAPALQRIEAQEAVEPIQGDDDPVLDGHRATGQAGAAAAGHERHPGGVTEPHGLDHLVLRVGEHDGARPGAKRRQAIGFVRRQRARVREQPAGREDACERGEQRYRG